MPMLIVVSVTPAATGAWAGGAGSALGVVPPVGAATPDEVAGADVVGAPPPAPAAGPVAVGRIAGRLPAAGAVPGVVVPDVVMPGVVVPDIATPPAGGGTGAAAPRMGVEGAIGAP